MAKGKAVATMEYDEKEYMAKADLHTLVEAEKIKGDAKRLAAAQKCAEKERKALNKVRKEA